MRIQVIREKETDYPPALQTRGFVLFSAALTKLFGTSHCQCQSARTAMLRPLISINRADLNRLCLCWRLPIYPDSTNSDTTSPRNRIRRDLLPVLRTRFNKNLDNVMSQSAEILSAEQLYIDLVVSKLSKTVEGGHREGYTELDPLPLAIKRAMLQQCVKAGLSQKKRLRFSSLERLLQKAYTSNTAHQTGTAHQSVEGFKFNRSRLKNQD